MRTIGAAVGVSHETIRSWIRRRAVPPFDHARRLHELYGIHPEEWRARREPPEPGNGSTHPRPLPAPIGSPAPGAASSDVTPAAVQGIASRLLAQAEVMLKELESYRGDPDDASGGLEARVRIAKELGATIASLGKHTGHTIVHAKQIMASPMWSEIKVAIAEALTPYPEAMRALAEALRRLDP